MQSTVISSLSREEMHGEVGWLISLPLVFDRVFCDSLKHTLLPRVKWQLLTALLLCFYFLTEDIFEPALIFWFPILSSLSFAFISSKSIWETTIFSSSILHGSGLITVGERTLEREMLEIRLARNALSHGESSAD